jgi:hypothetical protein
LMAGMFSSQADNSVHAACLPETIYWFCLLQKHQRSV